MRTVHVIYKLDDNISTDDICPNTCITGPGNPTPQSCAFSNIGPLRTILNNSNGILNMAIVCGDNFGCGLPPLQQAVDALQYYNITIVANSISDDFKGYCDSISANLIQCPTLNLDDIEVNDEIQIQARQVINRRTLSGYAIDPLKHKKTNRNKTIVSTKE